MPDQFTISVIGFADAEKIIVKSLINLIRLNDNTVWEYSENAKTDAYILSCRGDEGKKFIEQANDDIPIIVVGAKAELTNKNLTHVSEPLRSADLRNALLSISQFLQTGNQPAAEPHPAETQTEIVETVQPAPAPPKAETQAELEPLETVLLDQNNEQSYEVSADDFSFSFSKKLNFFSSSKPLEYLKSMGGNSPFTVKEISSDEFQAHLRGRTLDNLFKLRWYLGNYVYNVRLYPELRQNTRYKLSFWPDFGKLDYHRHHARLSSLLLTRSLTFEEIKNQSSLTDNVIIGFVNACYLCGWLIIEQDRRQTADAETPNKLPFDGTLINRLRKSLGIE